MSDVLLFVCDSCRQPRLLFARIEGRLLCGACWRRAGSPYPYELSTPEGLHATELATRERMLARGSTDRHLVRNGRT